MFTIIGGDGKEYGPVTLEQVKNWIADGRANLDTQAKRTGDKQWRRLGSFSEISGEPDTPPPPAPTVATIEEAHEQPQPELIDPKAYADDLIARAGPLDISGCFERAWALLKANFWRLVGTTTTTVVIILVINAIPVVSIFASMLLTGIFYGGLYAYYLKLIRGQPAEFGDIFDGFNLAFVPLMLATLVSQLLTTLGILLLILPGIYLAVAYAFTYMLVIDKKLEFWAAMEVSRRVITAQWWRLFGLMLLGILILMLGVVGLVVGVFIAMPIYMGALLYAYEDLCNPPKLD